MNATVDFRKQVYILHFPRQVNRKTAFSKIVFLVFLFTGIFCAGALCANGNGPDPAKLPPGIEKQIDRTGEAEIIVVLETSDIDEYAKNLRKSLRVKNDTREIIEEKAVLYKKKKDAVLNAVAPFSHALLHDYRVLPILHMQADRQAILKLLQMKEVLAVDENKSLRHFLTESLPLIQATDAHTAGATGANTAVAVLDTGVDYTRSAFGTCTGGNVPGDCCSGVACDTLPPPIPPSPPPGCKVACVHDFAPNDGSPDVYPYHGTNVSGIVAGVAPDAHIIGLDVFNGNSAWYSDILNAINWVITNKGAYNIQAVNMSMGGDRLNSPCPTDGLAVGIANLKTAGITTAVSSGNDGYTSALSSPACAPDAVSIGAVYDSNVGSRTWTYVPCTDSTTAADQITCFSNSAPFLTLLAPGSVITAAGESFSGTSQAAPHVAGSAAVIQGQYGSALSVDEVVSRMKYSGVPLTDAKSGVTTPRINLYGAAVTLAEPYLEYNPVGFYFKVPQGSNPNDATLNISFRGAGGPFGWSVSGNASWLSLSPLSGTGAGAVTVSINTTGLTPGTYNAGITIAATGVTNSPKTVPVTLAVLDPTYMEDFETGGLSKLPWETGGDGAWAVQGSTKHSGAYAAQSPLIGLNQSSYLQLVLNITAPGYVKFWLKTLTEPGSPSLNRVRFYMDGFSTYGKWDGWYGVNDWFEDRSEYSISPGVHTFKWLFSKDMDDPGGDDTVWLDDISFPAFQTIIPSLLPSSAGFGSVGAGLTSSPQTFTVSNSGTGNLIIGTVSFSGTNADQFTKGTDNCSGQTILPSGNCAVDVRFAPTSAGAKSALLSVPSNYPTVLTSALSGTGLARYTLTVNKTGSTGTGSVTSNPAGINCGLDCSELYTDGDSVTLNAAPDGNSTFTGWSDPGCPGTADCTVSMTADKTITATFTIKPPVADFSGAPPLSGTVPFNVVFTDLSANNPTSWSWDFGDLGASTLQNPSHTYKTAGAYTVSLTATNSSGSNGKTMTNYISVTPCVGYPVIQIGASPYSTIQDAFTNAVNGNVIQVQALDFTENPVFGLLDTSVTLEGGFNCDYSARLPETVINGSLTIEKGGVAVDAIVIK